MWIHSKQTQIVARSVVCTQFKFLPIVKEAEEQLQQKGFLSFWSSRRYEHAKMLIFLFQVSHILVCCQVRQSQQILFTGPIVETRAVDPDSMNPDPIMDTDPAFQVNLRVQSGSRVLMTKN
jgi:hypothetical protein